MFTTFPLTSYTTFKKINLTGKQLHLSRHQKTAPTLTIKHTQANIKTYPISLQLYCENDDDDDAVVEIH